jgi:hypothetical protein
MRAAAGQVLHAKGYISPVDVLLAMGRLTKQNYERWRFRQVPHLEKVLPGSLNEHAYFCRELRAYAREFNLKPSRTVYTSWGKGRRQPIRFSKYGDPRMEALFSTQYVSPTGVAANRAALAELALPVSAGRSPNAAAK